MATLTIDFETYYSQEYSLTKMTTEEYIRSHDFEVIGVAVQVDDGEPQWFSGTMAETELWLAEFDWGNNLALAHNAMFDAATRFSHFPLHESWCSGHSCLLPFARSFSFLRWLISICMYTSRSQGISDSTSVSEYP